jgi:hypothetical protein
MSDRKLRLIKSHSRREAWREKSPYLIMGDVT